MITARPPGGDVEPATGDLQPSAALTDLVVAAVVLEHAAERAREVGPFLLSRIRRGPLQLPRDATRVGADGQAEALHGLMHLDPKGTAAALVARPQRP